MLENGWVIAWCVSLIIAFVAGYAIGDFNSRDFDDDTPGPHPGTGDKWID